MSKRQPKNDYWQDAPMPRDQLVLFANTLEQRIPEDHPVRILDEILSRMDWRGWESEYNGSRGQPSIHPSILCKVLLFAMIRRIRSSRRIEYNLQHSIDFMWLASGRNIDHTLTTKRVGRLLASLGETQFAVLKAAQDLRRFLLRGHDGARQEWLWGCTAFNLNKLVRLWGGLRAKLNEPAPAMVN